MKDIEGGGWAANTKRNTVILGWWTAAWVLTMAFVKFGPEFIWASSQAITAVAIAINLAIGFGMIMANKRHLRGLDELHQKIQLEAMALSLGVGLVVGLSYSKLDVTGIIAFHAEISHIVIVMAIIYVVGVMTGIRKYR
jgi:hypothetical protein